MHTNGVFKKNEFSLTRNYMQETNLLGNQCQSLELHTTHIHSSNVFEVWKGFEETKKHLESNLAMGIMLLTFILQVWDCIFEHDIYIHTHTHTYAITILALVRLPKYF